MTTDSPHGLPPGVTWQHSIYRVHAVHRPDASVTALDYAEPEDPQATQLYTTRASIDLTFNYQYGLLDPIKPYWNANYQFAPTSAVISVGISEHEPPHLTSVEVSGPVLTAKGEPGKRIANARLYGYNGREIPDLIHLTLASFAATMDIPTVINMRNQTPTDREVTV